MTWHITLDESDEPVRAPDCADLLNLHDALVAIADALQVEAQRSGRAEAWGAFQFMHNALYDVHGAAGYLAKLEGLIG